MLVAALIAHGRRFGSKAFKAALRQPALHPKRPWARHLGQYLLLCVGTALAPAQASDSHSAPPITVYIVANGWHAGLVVPAQAVNGVLPALEKRFPTASHYEIGWGDIGFYQAKDVTVGLALQAMFASKGAVMHVVAVPDVAKFIQGSDVVPLCVDAASYQRMAALIANSFARTADGAPIAAGAGIYGDSAFYQATGSYSLINTCNRWTATVLQAGGLELSPRLSLTASSVLRAARSTSNNSAACAVR